MRTFIISMVGLVLVGCAAKELVPGAEKIIVTKTPAPAGCRFLGSVVGEQGGSFLGAYTSNRNLALGAMNDMKNQAFQMGANYVVIETNTAGNTSSGSLFAGAGGIHGSSHGGQTDVTNTGNAYRCNPSAIGLAE